MTPEIRKLQMLNDLVTQTLEALNQRVAFGGLAQQLPLGGFAQNPFGAAVPGAFGGLSHSPYVADVQGAFGVGTPSWQNPFGAVNPFGAINPYATGAINPYAIGAINPYATQVPFASQVANPYGWGAQAGAGLLHSPFVQQGMGMIPTPGVFPQMGAFGSPYGFGAPIVGPVSSGLSHTPYGLQAGIGGLGYLDPRLIDPRLSQLSQLGQVSRFGVTGTPYGAIW
jgi:hypothetical protein